MIFLAVWFAILPFRILAALGFRRSIIVLCLLVLAITGYGVAEDIGLIRQPPAHASPRDPSPGRQGSKPSQAARADIPANYLRTYRSGANQCPGLPWSILASIGKVESNHGRSTLPGVRSGWNSAGAAGPMQFGIGKGAAGNSWATYGRDYDRDGNRSVYDYGDAIPAAARYLCAHGAPRNIDRAIHGYNHSWSYVALVKQYAHRYAKRKG
jgi:hypothetical protein